MEAVEAVEAVVQSFHRFMEADVRKKLSHADGQGVGGLRLQYCYHHYYN